MTLEQALSGLSGLNRAYLEDLMREAALTRELPPGWRELFSETESQLPSADRLDPQPEDRRSIFGGVRSTTSTAAAVAWEQKKAAVLHLITAYRRNGHLSANLDPLGSRSDRERPELDPFRRGLEPADLDREFPTGTLPGPARQRLRDIIDQVQETYCGSVGSEFMYIRDEERRRWLQTELETTRSRLPLDRARALRVLEKLTAANDLEAFIHTRYVGAKRFSVEGAEAIIPLLDLLLDDSADLGVREVVVGMAHRGRLNVLANILGKSPVDIFSEFEGKVAEMGHLSGDVKYHMGFSSDVLTPSGKKLHVGVCFNPSHLEFVSPLMMGRVRAKQDYFRDLERRRVLPIAIHGDSAFIGQGVVAETFNFSRLPGYFTGGTVHIVINNQIGFTTPMRSARSSEHCTDIAKMTLCPIFHVNAEDLAAVAHVASLAARYRQKFRSDVVIDLWGYRRYGHNEGDEPRYTQPKMYDVIRDKKTPLELFTSASVAEGLLTQEDVDRAASESRARLEEALRLARSESPRANSTLAGVWRGLVPPTSPEARDFPTRVDQATLTRLGEALHTVPEGFHLNRKLLRAFKRQRAQVRGEAPLQWATAENLAYATLLREAHPVRISGQDSGRGTFSHRHAVWHDQETGETWLPHNALGGQQARFEVYDSPLSEAAVLGFELGYSMDRPGSLVIWEAQFGDFANGAQVIIDQFVCSSHAKWNRFSGLVLLLPHGYEGQGPEHSSARLERFLQLSGEENWQVVNLTTPAQIFHALRGQLHRNFRRPLVVMSPKSLLRHRRAVSPLSELVDGGFQPIIPDGEQDPASVERLVLCSGKVYYDLLDAREEAGLETVALTRVEQLYPLRMDLLQAELARFPKLRQLVWCQEEPRNQGAWTCLLEQLQELSGDLPLHYAGRAAASSPATGFKHLHVREQKELTSDALGLQTPNP